MSTLAATSRARLNRDELHQLRWLLGLALVLLAFWTLYSLEVGGFAWRTLFFITAATAMVFPGWPGHIPDWIRRWSLILGGSALFTQFIATRFDIISGLVLMVSLLTLSRGLQYRRIREDWQLILLCLFIIILSGVLTLSLLFGLQILIFTLVAMALLFVMNLLERDSARSLTTADWQNFRWRSFLRKVRDALDVRQLFQAAGLFTGLVLVSTLIFVSIPRFQFAQSLSMSSQKGIAGFHSDIEYSESRGFENDDTRAFRVDMPNGVSLPATPYWRMIVLDDYRNNKFQLSSSMQYQVQGWRTAAHYNLGALSTHLRDAQRFPGAVVFYLEGNVSEYLPILGPFDSLILSDTQRFLPNENLKIYRTEQPLTKALAYHVEDMDFSDAMPAAAPEEDAKLTLDYVLQHYSKGVSPYPFSYFSLPASDTDRKIIQLIVDQIKAGQPNMTETQFLGAAIDYLRKNHAGSMDVDLAKVRGTLVDESLKPTDFLVKWLDSNSPGWCEHFSGAFVLLCRTAGYPARVVAGYRGAIYNTIDNYYSVPQSYAHAWAEVFDESRKDRWLRVDPSPGAPVVLPGVQPGPVVAGITTESGWNAFMDGLRMIWYRRVINFDETDQQELVAKATDYGKGFAVMLQQWLTDVWTTFKEFFTTPLTPRRAVTLSSLALALSLSLLFRRRMRNFWLRVSARWWPHSGHRLAPVRVDAGRWLSRFQPAWQSVAPILPASEHAEWARVRLDLLTLRYGPADLPADPAGTFRKARLLLRACKNLKPANSG